MTQHPHTPQPPDDDHWEDDAVWNLLDHASTPTPTPDFVQRVILAAQETPTPWWHAYLTPRRIATLATAAAAITISAHFLVSPSLLPSNPPTQLTANAATIEEIANAEILSSAAEHLDSFSDTELVALIGL